LPEYAAARDARRQTESEGLNGILMTPTPPRVETTDKPELRFECSICSEPSARICVYCAKDCCVLHQCEICQRCSDCCVCPSTKNRG
jgi:hypothetical protein